MNAPPAAPACLGSRRVGEQGVHPVFNSHKLITRRATRIFSPVGDHSVLSLWERGPQGVPAGAGHAPLLGMATRSAGASALQQHGRARGPGGVDAQPCRAGLAGGGFGSPCAGCWVCGLRGGPGPGSHPPVAAQRMAPPSSASRREDGQGRRARPRLAGPSACRAVGPAPAPTAGRGGEPAGQGPREGPGPAQGGAGETV